MLTTTENTTIESLRDELHEMRKSRDFMQSITSYGYMDIDTARKWLDESGCYSYGEFGNYLEERADDFGVSLSKMDVCAAALDYICIEAAAQELSDYTYANSMCSQFDIDPEKAGKSCRECPKMSAIRHGNGWLNSPTPNCRSRQKMTKKT